MDKSSDSDDSAFLFSASYPKRNIGFNDRNKLNKLRNNTHEISKTIEEIEEQKRNDNSSIEVYSQVCGNKVNLVKDEILPSHKKLAQELNAEKTSKNCEDHYSCALCLKIFHSEAAHFTHMKQCAKKSKMSTKQLLEALQLHKRHLKERLSAGLSNIPKKKKKTRVQEENEDSANQLAIALALSKSLLTENDGGKENQKITDSVSMQCINKTTLENFGFKTTGKINTGTGKNSKSGKITHSILRERTNEEREKLMTEKASVVLLINNYSPMPEIRQSLRMYHCERLEKSRKKDSYLWRLGEMIDVSEWYVKDLKNVILEVSQKIEGKTQEKITEERCNIDKEILKLNLPKNKIFEDWRRLINNKHLSDISLYAKDGEAIYLHSVVLYARCPKLLDFDMNTVFRKFNSAIILNFLQFLYCGTLNELMREDIENLYILAQSVDCAELVGILESLKQLLLKLKVSNGKCNDSGNLENDFSYKCHEEISSLEKINLDEPVCKKLSDFEREDISSPTLRRKNQNEWNKYEELGRNHGEESFRSWKGEESGTGNELTNLLHEEKSMTAKNDKPSPCTDKSNIGEKPRGIGISNVCEHGVRLEMDLFEETENLDETVKNFQNGSKATDEDDLDCIQISSGSTRSSTTQSEIMGNTEENDNFPSGMDFEIPYFDPYEHFNTEISETEPFVSTEEQNILSQSLIVGEISPTKLTSTKYADGSCLNDASPGVSAPGYSSTPIIEIPSPNISTKATLILKDFSERAKKKRRCGTPCSKINRKLARLSLKPTVLDSNSGKYGRAGSVETPSKKLADTLTQSILKEFDNSIGSSVGQNAALEDKSYIEMTPAIPGEEYVEDVSPLPDYSKMGASSIKKHLSKYGLKKSLSKNKAKKILRHIYEELHPIVNLKNGKIVKYIRGNKSKKSKGKKVRITVKKKGKENSIGKKLSSPAGKEENKSEMCCSEQETPVKKGISKSLEMLMSSPPQSSRSTVEDNLTTNSKLTPPKPQRTVVEDDSQSWSSIDSSDGFSGRSGACDENYFEVEESLSQGIYASAQEASAAVYDFIENNREIHRKVLQYKPILLEDLKRQLTEKYNKKFRLTDLMDCLDLECITFNWESTKKKTNSQRNEEVRRS